MQFIQDGIRYNSIADGKVSVEGFGLNMDMTDVVIPHYTKKGYMVIGISSNAFAENKIIKTISIPNTICFIEEKAFYKCSNLQSVIMTTSNEQNDFEESVAISLREKAFSGCKNLTQFTSTKVINLLGKSIFKNCALLPKINGQICGNLPEKCFYNCFSLTEFSFTSISMEIGIDCFEGCSNIKDFYLQEDVELNEEFLNRFKDCKFHCNKGSKYLNLAYSGYHIREILPKV